MNKDDQKTPTRTKPWNYGLVSTDEIGELEKEYVLQVLNKKRVFRFHGSDVEQSEAYKLERLYKERLGASYCLALNSGTSALIASLIGAGIGPGDEVIVPAYTYIATASAVLVARAVPVIVEVDDTLTMDPKAFEAAITPHTKAVIPVHMRGVPCQMDEIMSIARKHGLIVIEDVAQANGGVYKGKPLGTIGDAGCFSFQQFKLVTSGEGGMIATNNEKIYSRASVYHDSAFVYWGMNTDKSLEFFPGENYRMSELHAAVGLAQSQRIDSLIEQLQTIKRTITAGIEDLPQIALQRIPDQAGDVSYSLVFYLPSVELAERFSQRLEQEGIQNGTINNNGFADRHIYSNWTYIMEKKGASDQGNPWNCESYKGNATYSKDMCPNTLDLLSRAVAISLHQSMTTEDADEIVRAIRLTAQTLSEVATQ